MLGLLVSLKVEEKPLPPWEAMVVVAGSRDKALRIAGSRFGAMIVVL